MRWINPPRLVPGDQVALLSPASPPAASYFERGFQQLRQLGFIVSIGLSAKKKRGYLAGHDQARGHDFLQALINPKIKAIFCTRGGYGSSRLLETIDLSLIRRYPKALIGYSDITLLHLAYQQQRVTSFWGPMPCTRTGFSSQSRKWFQAICMTRPADRYPLCPPQQAKVILPGLAQGRLTGGTLSLLAASLGTPYEIETKDKVVFFEDIGEAPYKLDRYLTQLLAANKLKDAQAFLIGRFSDCSNSQPGATALQVLKERLWPLQKPILSRLPVGHINRQITLPYGRLVTVDTTQQQVWLHPA